MTYSYKKFNSLRPQKEKTLQTFLIALGVAFLFFIPYIIYDSGYFLFYGDYDVQQVPFYKMCHEMVRTGNISWNWGTDLGVNFIGSYTFYLLGSPFFWITLLFPNWMVPHLMGPLLILKFACSALTSYWYIRRFTKTPHAAQLGALLYAFSGFSVYNIFFNHFHEAIVFFPLLLLSVELFITENRRGFFAFMVAMCAIVNYFFFFGMVIFVVIYWFVRVIYGCYKLSLGRFFAFIFEAVIGLALSVFLLYPSLLAIIQNSRLDEISFGWSAIMYGKEQIYANIIQCFFFPPDLPARPVFFPNADVKWSSLGGWLPIFSMVGVGTLFSNKKKNWLKTTIGILIFMALVPILNSSFYAFNSAYYARWYYMPILMMSLATVMMCEDRKVDWKSSYSWVLGITLAVTGVIGLFPQIKNDKMIFGIFSNSTDKTYIARFWYTCAIAIIGLLVLKLLLNCLKKNPKIFYRNATIAVCIASVIYASVFIGIGKSISYNAREVMIPELVEGEVDLEKGDYRIDVYGGIDNTGMYLGLNSINAFHSVVPVSVTEFWEYVGEERGVASRPTVDSYAARSLLSVKYLLNRTGGDNFLEDDTKDPQMPGFEYVSSSGGYYIYENKNYIPYGFTYDYYITKEQCDTFTADERSNVMLKALVLDKEQEEKYSHLFKNVSEDFNVTYDGGETNRLIIPMTKESYAADCADRAANSAVYFNTDNKGFTAGITNNRENLVFFSVPYDEGWSATVNGNPVTIEKVNIGFMAVLVPAGDNTIRFEYETPGLKMGVIISAAALFVLMVYLFVFKMINKRNPGSTEYPEGDALLQEWTEYEIEDARLKLEIEMNNRTEEIVDIPKPKHISTEFEGGFEVNLDVANDENNES